jgi:hypothetical protein
MSRNPTIENRHLNAKDHIARSVDAGVRTSRVTPP